MVKRKLLEYTRLVKSKWLIVYINRIIRLV